MQALASQCKAMELAAAMERREREIKFAAYALQLGAGIGIAAATGGAGLFPYLAGASAFSGVGIALDPAIHDNIKEGNWVGFAEHASYHLPLIGSGRNAWDAYQDGKPWQAVGHTGLLGVEAFGVRGVGKVRWGEKSVPIVKGNIWESTIQQTFKNLGSLKGVGLQKADEMLKLNGFVFRGKTPGSYCKYYHPNGAKIQIRPNGQIYRYGGGKGKKYHVDGSSSASHDQENIFN